MKKYTFFAAVFIVSMLMGRVCSAQGGIVYTVAGCYTCFSTSVDAVPATMASLINVTGIAVDAAHNVFVGDAGLNKVRKVDGATNLIYNFAGSGTSGFSGDGGPATAANLLGPQGICLDGAGNLYIADAGNNRIRKVTTATGIINTIAGGGASTADGVPAISASLTPQCVYVDGAGNIYTGGSNKVRKIDPVTGLITTVAGDGTAGDSGDGGPALSAGIAGPVRSITMDAAGNMFIISAAGDRVRKIDAVTGIIKTIAGGGICTSEGVPATNALLQNIRSCIVDPWVMSFSLTGDR